MISRFNNSFRLWLEQPASAFNTPSSQPGPHLRIGDHLLFWTSSLIFTIYYAFLAPTFNGNVNASFEKMVYGHAAQPYVYRLAMPVLVRAAAEIIPDPWEAALNNRLVNLSIIQEAMREDKWQDKLLTLHLIAAVIMWLCVLGFLYVLRSLLLALFTASALFATAFPMITLFGLYPLVKIRYIYDPSTLLLFTLGLLLMARANWRAYLFIFLLGSLNKETTILLCMVFVIYYGVGFRMDSKRFSGLLFAQLAIFGIIKLCINWAYADNAGGAVEFHLFDHNLPLLLNFNYFSMTEYWIALALLLLFFYRWGDQHAFLKSAVWIVLPLGILMIFFGWLNEARIFLEAVPIVSLIYAYNIGKLLGLSIQKQGELLSPVLV